MLSCSPIGRISTCWRRWEASGLRRQLPKQKEKNNLIVANAPKRLNGCLDGYDGLIVHLQAAVSKFVDLGEQSIDQFLS